MKTILSLLLCIILCLSLFACNSEKAKSSKESAPTIETQPSKTVNKPQASETKSTLSNNENNQSNQNIIKYIEIKDGKFVFPDSKVTRIKFEGPIMTSDGYKLEYTKRNAVESTITSLKNGTLVKTKNPGYSGPLGHMITIYYEDGTYSSIAIELIGREHPIYFFDGEYYTFETLDQSDDFIAAFSYPYASIINGIKDVEFSNGFISFDNLLNIFSVEIITYYFDEKGYNIGDNSVSYRMPQNKEHLLDVLSCLEFFEIDPSTELPISGHDYTLFKINTDSHSVIQIKMIK